MSGHMADRARSDRSAIRTGAGGSELRRSSSPRLRAASGDRSIAPPTIAGAISTSRYLSCSASAISANRRSVASATSLATGFNWMSATSDSGRIIGSIASRRDVPSGSASGTIASRSTRVADVAVDGCPNAVSNASTNESAVWYRSAGLSASARANTRLSASASALGMSSSDSDACVPVPLIRRPEINS